MIFKEHNVDVDKILKAMLIDFHESGLERTMNCFWHQDRGSNLSISTRNGMYQCWVCSTMNPLAKGNLIQFVMRVKTMEWEEALDFILTRSQVTSTQELIKQLRDTLSRKKKRHWPTIDISEWEGQGRLWWLAERGIDEAIFDRFRLGFSNNTREAIIPITDNHRPISIIRRRTYPTKERYRYPKGFKKEEFLFGLDQCSSPTLCLVEGAIDAMKVFQAGYHAVATLGDHLSHYQWEQIQNYGPEHLVIMADEDFGGQVLSMEIWKNSPIRSVYYVKLTEKDPGACTTEEIRYAVKHREHVLKGLLQLGPQLQ